ncbi:MAG: DNA replication/repair protein RecF [Eubacteriales bacterium]
MIIKSLELCNYRNYETLRMDLEEGTNILHGNNAQGKTNILESIYLTATTKSHKGSKDKEIIRFGEEQGHIKIVLEKYELTHIIDIHLRNHSTKVIAINQQKIKKATELLGLLNVVFFSPEDLGIIKEGPSKRRRFVDMELCQLDKYYLYNLDQYNKIINQRNKLLKDITYNASLIDTINIWDAQLYSYGSKVIEKRENFIEQINEILYDIHKKLSGDHEELSIQYEPNITIDQYEKSLENNQGKDIRSKQTSVGPHRDDFVFIINGVDIRKYGSQGQQRTAVLSLKLAELELMKKITKENPILLLDDVLSELDSKRQNYLLNTIGNIQTIVTGTGIEEFVKNRFQINKVFEIKSGTIIDENINEIEVLNN